MSNPIREVAIVGAGIAGASAAIQLKRFGADICLVEKNCVGGLARNANLIENYPGFPRGIAGSAFASLIVKQLNEHEIEIVHRSIESITYTDKFEIQSSDGIIYAQNCIVATGTRATIPDIELDNMEGVYTEIVDISECSGKQITIVGGGDAAFDYALNLGRKNKVSLLIRDQKARGLHLLVRRANENPNITILKGVAPTKLVHSAGVLQLFCTFDDSIAEYHSDFLIFATGRQPALPEINVPSGSTGFYTIGDATNGPMRQCAIAAGDGLRAALAICNSLRR